MNKLKVGIVRETKNPPDRRVVLTPNLVLETQKRFPNIELFVQPSAIRCFSDREYEEKGIKLTEDLSHCDILLGVKEVNIPELIPGKKYLFFSHTAKKQLYNKPLLKACLKKNIQLIDHEYLTDTKGNRLVAFGKWAGVVGAYNALIAYGKRTGKYHLPRANELHDQNELIQEISKIKLPAIKILITGGGRVAHGALETFSALNLRIVDPDAFLNQEFDMPVVCQLNPDAYVRRIDGSPFDLMHFFKNPSEYESTFKPYTKVADVFVACHFWNPESPYFLMPEDYTDPGFRIKVIADVSCDIKQPIASTLRASAIAEPFYGYNPQTGDEDDPWNENNVTVMAVDNLPGELPRNSSEDFGSSILERVFPSLFGEDVDGIIERASITKNGKLTDRFMYLKEYSESE